MGARPRARSLHSPAFSMYVKSLVSRPIDSRIDLVVRPALSALPVGRQGSNTEADDADFGTRRAADALEQIAERTRTVMVSERFTASCRRDALHAVKSGAMENGPILPRRVESHAVGAEEGSLSVQHRPVRASVKYGCDQHQPDAERERHTRSRHTKAQECRQEQQAKPDGKDLAGVSPRS